MKRFVGNVSHETTDADLRSAFEKYGQVEQAEVVKDRYSGDPRGFAFVEMPNKNEAIAAIRELNGSDLKGRPIRVDEARPRDSGGGSGGGRGGGGGGGGRGGGFGGGGGGRGGGGFGGGGGRGGGGGGGGRRSY
jgi:RNA recognition motif-containing protein